MEVPTKGIASTITKRDLMKIHSKRYITKVWKKSQADSKKTLTQKPANLHNQSPDKKPVLVSMAIDTNWFMPQILTFELVLWLTVVDAIYFVNNTDLALPLVIWNLLQENEVFSYFAPP